MTLPEASDRRALQGSRVEFDHPLMTDEDAVTGLMDERPETYQAGDFLDTASPRAIARLFATVHELVLDVVDCKADSSSQPYYPRHYTTGELNAMRNTARLYRDTLARISGLPGEYLDNALQEQYAQRTEREAALRAKEESAE